MNQQNRILFLENVFDLPNPEFALVDPDGLVAVSPDLAPERLLFLYQHGFFPWYSPPDPMLWWHPSNRCVLQPQHFHCSRSLKKAFARFKKQQGEIRVNYAFDDVIHHCCHLRQNEEGTWISPDIIESFTHLHQQGYAHSVEVWHNNQLVGGFYGLAIGQIFFGESMFSLVPNASKFALLALCQNAEALGIELIDCQVESEHLLSLGAELMPRASFVEQLAHLIQANNVKVNKVQPTNRTPLELAQRNTLLLHTKQLPF
ncbi:leucyl/phenylalanyl-tRNA--protein transferase [Marinomonas agarivorans]|nr:leucyl/phenylalanyl-tRNA--protein transferase [Marinomonas agarivorans]